MTNKTFHIFIKKTDKEILEHISKLIKEGHYERFTHLVTIAFSGDYAKRRVTVEYEVHDPYFSGENS